MKYGVIVCRDTDNIGDDIQSYAAACLLPRVDYYIEREHMDVFRPQEPQPVNVIVNGWMMNNKLGWPLSACINPLYISLHFLEDDPLRIGGDFLQGIGGEDLRKHEPIGCRDTATLNMLEKYGIKGYFSACITLTLPKKFIKKEDKPYICLVDVPEQAENYVRARYPEADIRIVEHVPVKQAALVDRSGSWNQRFRRVEELLQLYQNASAVLTTRLHCALPCLALETPVLYLQEDPVYDPGRLEGLSELFLCAGVKDYVGGHTEFDLLNPPGNPDIYRSYRNQILKSVQDFLEACPAEMEESDKRMRSYDAGWEERALWKDQILLRLVNRQNESWKKDHQVLERMADEKRWLEQQYQALKKDNAELREWTARQAEEIEWHAKEKERFRQECEKLGKWTKEQEKVRIWQEDRYADLTEKNNDLKSIIQKREYEIQDLKKEKETLRESLEAAEAESVTWRMHSGHLLKKLEFQEMEYRDLIKAFEITALQKNAAEKELENIPQWIRNAIRFWRRQKI